MLNNWFITKHYQIEEAVFNQFSREIWISDTRNIVDSKFSHAMNTMSLAMLEGKIEVRTAVSHFGSRAFMDRDRIWRLDPLTGKNRFYNKNDFYFFMLDDSMAGSLTTLQTDISNISR